MKKKIIGSVLVLGIVAAAAGLFVPNAVQKITKESVITSSQLEKAVDISELSTAEFIYNGIADKYSDGNLEETECHIAYASTVKVGIELDKITFTIDEKKKTVTPVLPEITVNTVTVDPDSLSFIPQNPDVELKDIMTVCKEDALKEASESKELYQTAEENLQSAIEALLSPILKNAGYTMQWDIYTSLEYNRRLFVNIMAELYARALDVKETKTLIQGLQSTHL